MVGSRRKDNISGEVAQTPPTTAEGVFRHERRRIATLFIAMQELPHYQSSEEVLQKQSESNFAMSIPKTSRNSFSDRYVSFFARSIPLLPSIFFSVS